MFAYPLDDALQLTLVAPRHGPDLFAAVDANRTHLRQWHPWVDRTRSVNDSRGAIVAMQAAYHAGGQMQTAIYENHALVGMVGFNQIDAGNRLATLGYWLIADAQGRGIVTRACRAYLAHGFDTLGLNRIEIRCGVDNERSRRVAERLGFSLEGILHDREWLYDHFIDHAIYGLKTPHAA
ncbi:GNAT family N-acetyltransferase [Salinisphaera sp. Q1T1-3]|uniref:GNAT family N-acetyltransferase n=1 Tax=Salinisphaera sp. Q1T1-3 TaxID=2321229 RepID=UPI000E73996E|nr:GNAT family N-acetyltransferase [Salinisphaera sp. Q1T1-3]RJS93763.1 GNAT family N-acetyltransferase [Salinisphaera sp. Q1T1-3]